MKEPRGRVRARCGLVGPAPGPLPCVVGARGAAGRPPGVNPQGQGDTGSGSSFAALVHGITARTEHIWVAPHTSSLNLERPQVLRFYIL